MISTKWVKSLKKNSWIIFFAMAFGMQGCFFSGSDDSSSSAAPSTNILSGLIQYEDRLFDIDGFTGSTSLKPLRYADVQLERESDSAVLLRTSTNGNGEYSLDINRFIGEKVKIRSLSSTEKSGKKVTVRSGTSTGSLYSIVSDSFIIQGGTNTKNLKATISLGSAEYFNVFENLITGALFIESITGAVLTKSADGIYPNGADDGTYFDGSSLFICAGCSSDDDGWDDTVILHEFGHLVANAYSKDDSPGGTHSLLDPLEITLAWSEGWATFFASAARSFSSESSPENYIDTNGANGSSIGISYEIETPSKYNTVAFGGGYEVAVTSVLWDIFDSNSDSEDFDTLSLGIGNGTSGIWKIFSGYLPTVTSVSIEDLWDGWFSQNQGSLGGANDITNIFQARKIYYRADIKETGNNLLDDDSSDHATNLTVGTALTDGTPSGNLTFYPAGDTDWFTFSYVQGKTYVIQTLNLGSGSDPIMWLYSNPTGSAVCSNDDISVNDLNSKQTVPGTTGTICSFSGNQTIYVKVQSSPESTGNLALYGNYNIKVTSN